MIPGLPPSQRIMDSSGALELRDVPKSLLVIGGGYIGLELGTVYAALGSKVTVVEMLPQILTGADRDLVNPLAKRLEKMFSAILLNTKVVEIKEAGDGIKVRLEGPNLASPEQTFDKVLVSVGRKPNVDIPGLENTRVTKTQKGFIEVDLQRRTKDPIIYAIGDIAGEPMLAHKASREGRVAVEAIMG
jgi:dihydrolipoamide dehydrogenase